MVGKAETQGSRWWAARADYFEVAPESWLAHLESLARLGFTHVDVRIPWGLHEQQTDKYDFGQQQAQLDFRRYFEIAGELGLGICARIGPRQERSVDLPCDGLPQRIVWTRECQALSRRGNPIVQPRWAGSFPEPSLFSDAYADQCEAWLTAVAQQLADFEAPSGPLAMVVLDSRGTLETLRMRPDCRDGALSAFRQFLRARYGEDHALAAAYGDAQLNFERVEPPARSRADGGCTRAWSDWFDFADAQTRMQVAHWQRSLRVAGLERTTIARSRGVAPMASDHAGELTDVTSASPTIAELSCAFELSQRGSEDAVTWAALLDAVGVSCQRFSVGPVHPRAGHVGSLLDASGNPTPISRRLSEVLKRLAALPRGALERRVDAQIALPRWLVHGWWSWNVLYPVGLHPLSPSQRAGLDEGGGTSPSVDHAPGRSHDGASDDDSGEPTQQQLLDVLELIERLGSALNARGLSWRFIGLDDAIAPVSVAPDTWTFVPNLRRLDDATTRVLRPLVEAGTPITFWPHPPDDPPSWLSPDPASLLHARDAASVARWLEQQLTDGRLPVRPAPQRGVRFHHLSAPCSKRAQYRVIVLTNSSNEPATVSLDCPHHAVVDSSVGDLPSSEGHRLDLTVPAGTVRVLELHPTTAPGDEDPDAAQPLPVPDAD